MKITIEVQSNKCGEEYLDEEKQEIEIYKEWRGESIVLEVDNKQYIIPIEVFKGLV